MQSAVDNDPNLHRFSTFVSKELGENTLQEIVVFTSHYFQVDYVHIALLQEDLRNAEVIEGYLDGELLKPGYVYALEGTPCANVIHKTCKSYPDHVQELFPNDADLVSLQAQSYIGEPLIGNDGNVIGLIVLVSRKTLPSSQKIESLMRILAGRASIEISRQNVVSMLRKEHENLQLILDYAPIGIWLQNTQGKIGFVNKAFTEAVGIPEDKFLSVEHYMELIPDAFKPQCIASDEKALAAQGVSISYQQLPFVDGKIHDLKVIKAVKRDDKGKPLALVGLSIDISEDLRKQEELKKSEMRFRTIFNQIDSIAVQGYDENRNVIYWNNASETIYGYTCEEAMGQNLIDLIIPEPMREGVIDLHAQWLEKGIAIPPGELSLLNKSGQEVHVYSSHILMENMDGKKEMYCVDVDIRDIIESQKRVAESEHLLREVMGIAKEGIWDWHIPQEKIFHNREWYQSLMLEPDNNTIATLEYFLQIIHPDDRDQVKERIEALIHGQNDTYNSEHRLIRKDGTIIWVQDRGQIIEKDPNGNPIRLVGAFTDITHQKTYQTRLEHIAHYDPLTGLPNRILNAERLQQAIHQADRNGTLVAVLFLDLDGFKHINDTYGHETGDKLLTLVSRNIDLALREEDTLSRLGGDEFIAILANLPSTAHASSIIARLMHSFSHPITIEEKTFHITASIGVAFYPQKEAVDGDQLLRQADLAMYAAKQSGKNRYHIFDSDHDHTIRTRHQMVQKIKDGLAKGEFELHYQPKVNMRSGTFHGAEALIRWNHPTEGILNPGNFLPCIENETIAIEIGEWVIDSALKQLSHFHAKGYMIGISVNVGASQLLNGDFYERLKSILDQHPTIDPHFLEIEILETSALENLDAAVSVMDQCISLGISFSLDDFGTGYSSLSYLKKLPISTLKIDQSFVRDILTDPDDLVIVQGIIGLAHAFGKKLVAEGVESVEIAKKLIELGCEDAQGYWIGKPMQRELFCSWIETWKSYPGL